MEILVGEYKAKSIRFLINNDENTEFYYDKDIGFHHGGEHIKYDKVIIKDQNNTFNVFHFRNNLLVSNRVYFYPTLKQVEFILDEKLTEDDID